MKKSTMMFLVLCFAVVAAAFFSPAHAAEKTKKAAASVAVADGKTVKVNYTLTVDGKVVDSSKDRGPFEFKEGGHQVVPGFEKALMGMKVGQKKSFTVKPEEGYGTVNPTAYRDVPKSQLPKDMTPKAGMTLLAQTKDGQKVPVTIKEVKKDSVVMDFNHPLAGKTLKFDVEVIEVK